MIFAVFDVLLAVNMCINYSFFYIYNNNRIHTNSDIQLHRAATIEIDHLTQLYLACRAIKGRANVKLTY